MADIRELVQQAALQADALDLDALRARAQAVGARDQRRQRVVFGGAAGVVVLVVAMVASPLFPGGGDPRGDQVAVGQDASPPVEEPTGILGPLATATAPTEHPMVVVPPSSPGDDGMHVDPSPNPYPDEGIRTYEVQPGDTLSTIAAEVYGDPTAFGVIANANGLDDDGPMFVGQILTIPPEPLAHPEPVPTREPDSALEAALGATVPEGWVAQPVVDGHRRFDLTDRDGGIRLYVVAVPAGSTAEALVQEAIDAGEAPVELPDGALGSFRNPPATHGRLLVPLPGNQLIEITGEGNLSGTLDYELGVLLPWMADLRAALG